MEQQPGFLAYSRQKFLASSIDMALNAELIAKNLCEVETPIFRPCEKLTLAGSSKFQQLFQECLDLLKQLKVHMVAVGDNCYRFAASFCNFYSDRFIHSLILLVKMTVEHCSSQIGLVSLDSDGAKPEKTEHGSILSLFVFEETFEGKRQDHLARKCHFLCQGLLRLQVGHRLAHG